MVSAVAAVVTTVATVKGARDQKKAQQAAADDQRSADIQSANLLAEAGRNAEADILRQKAKAEHASRMAEMEAIDPLQDFANIDAYNQSVDQIMSNMPIGGAIAESIKKSSIDYIQSRPEFQSSFLRPETERQAELSVSAATPQFTESLVSAGQQGLAAATDIARIKQGGLNRLGDIAGGTASQRSSVLVGKTPELSNFSQSANESRLLSDVASQNFRANTVNQVAGLAGQLIPSRKTDEFGFRRGEDPFEEF